MLNLIMISQCHHLKYDFKMQNQQHNINGETQKKHDTMRIYFFKTLKFSF